MLGHQDAAGAQLEKLADSDISKALLDSLGKSLTSIGVLGSKGGVAVFQPRLSLFNIAAAPENLLSGRAQLHSAAGISARAGGVGAQVKALKELRGNAQLRTGLSAIAPAVSNALIRTLTANASGETQRQLSGANKQLREAIVFQQDMLLSAVIQKISVGLLRRSRNEIAGLRERLFALKADCEFEDQAYQCSTRRAKRLAQTDRQRDATIGALERRREALQGRVRELRQSAAQHFAQVQEVHRSLQKVRDRLADARYLEKHRDSIQQLARQARDPQVRDKYRVQLKQLETAGNADELAGEEKRLVAKRTTLWEEIEQTQARIREQIEAAEPVYEQIGRDIVRAMTAYDEQRRHINSAYYSCVGIKPFAAPSRPLKSVSAVQQKAELEIGQIFPHEIYHGLERHLDKLIDELRKLQIQAVRQDRESCRARAQVATPFANANRHGERSEGG